MVTYFFAGGDHDTPLLVTTLAILPRVGDMIGLPDDPSDFGGWIVHAVVWDFRLSIHTASIYLVIA